MKAKLIFNLPDDSHEWENATKGASMHSTLWEYDQWLRGKIKYDDLTDEQYQVYQGCRDKLRTVMYENDINLDNG
jgi:hypothetical protein